ncbi:hypothetical protein [Amycolatopsis nigrescens]|uniref:hypothetical protein n=1 Tax=Amycolatopsis nigrescens TaxID=381445 RepID=UPI00037CE383|nr:hypothetical protein [Amycolatopsis nigrescens]
MGTAWSAEQVVTAVRDSLGRSGATSQGFRLDAVWPERGELVLTFRWWRDPNTYAVRFPLPDGALPESPWTGLPVASARDWAQDLAGLLAEELDTGAVRRARRLRHNGLNDTVELDWRDAVHPCPPGYYSSAVVLPDALPSGLRADFGRSLGAAGLDVTTPQRQYRRGELLSWRKLCTDSTSPEPVGHASVAWHPALPATATLDVLQLLPGVPDAAAPYLARMAVHDAAEAGAQQVRAECAHPRLAEAGFRQTGPSDSGIVDTTALD